VPKYTKAGTIPIRIRGKQLEICFVTSLSRQSILVLPKGTISHRERPRDTAIRETYEEAGVEGKLLRSWKKTRIKSIKARTREYRAKYFILLVDTIHQSWPEKSRRKRHWLNARALRRKNTLKRDRDVIRNMLKLGLHDLTGKTKKTPADA